MWTKMTAAEQEPAHATVPRRRVIILYSISALISLGLLAAIVMTWYRVQTAPPPVYPGEAIMTTQDEVTRYMNANTPPSGGEPNIYIPTGIVLQSTEFKGPYTVQVSGYIWQRYADSLPQDLQKGV